MTFRVNVNTVTLSSQNDEHCRHTITTCAVVQEKLINKLMRIGYLPSSCIKTSESISMIPGIYNFVADVTIPTNPRGAATR